MIEISKRYARWIKNDVFVQRMQLFIQYLLQTQQKMNLVGSTDLKDILIHIEESMEFFHMLKQEDYSSSLSLLDIGSGGGFPGIPLALAQNCWKIYLSDAVRKKASFLEWMKQSLNLDQVSIFQNRVELFSQEFPEKKFNIITAKGVGKLKYLMNLSRNLIQTSGLLIVWKSAEEMEHYMDGDFFLEKEYMNSCNKSMLSFRFKEKVSHVC